MRTKEQINNIKNGRQKDLEKRMQNNEYCGSLAPYGYTLINKRLVIDKNVSHIVYLIYDLFYCGYTYTKIAEYLNKRNIVNPATYRKNKIYIQNTNDNKYMMWDKGSVRKILINKVYNGYYNYSDIKTHESIINDCLFNKVQNIIKENKDNIGNNFYDYNGNIFSGKVLCGECGRPFSITVSKHKNGIIKYLRCSSYDKRKNNIVKCTNKSIKYEDLKKIVLLYIEENIFNKIDLDIINKISDKENDYLNSIDKYYLIQEKKIINNLLLNIKELKLRDLFLDRLEEIIWILNKKNTNKKINKYDLNIDKKIIDNFIYKIHIKHTNIHSIKIFFK